MSYIKLGIKSTISEKPLYKTTEVVSETRYQGFNIYKAKINTFFSAIEITSYLFSGYNYQIFTFDQTHNIQYHFESLCLFYKNILGVIEHTISDELRILSFIIETEENTLTKEYITLKLLYSYALTFYNTYPNAIIIGSEISNDWSVPSIEFYYDRMKDLGCDVEVHKVLQYYKLIYTTRPDEAYNYIDKYNSITQKYEIVIPVKLIFPHEASFGFYLQSTGWNITYKSDKWVAINKNDMVSLDRKFLVTKDEVHVESTKQLTAFNILHDAINNDLVLIYSISVYYNNNYDIYCITRSCFETGNYNMGLQIDKGVVTLNINYYNYDVIIRLLESIKHRLNRDVYDSKWSIKPYNYFSTLLNTDDFTEVVYILKCIYGDQYAIYDTSTGGTFIVYDESICLPDHIIERINSEPLPVPDLQGLNNEDYEPITTEKYGELTPIQKNLLVKLRGRYYMMNSLILLIENEINVNRHHPRDPTDRSILSRKDILHVYEEANRILGIKRPLTDFSYPNMQLLVEKDREWIRVYIDHNDSEYTVLYLPVFDPNTPLLQPVQNIIDLVKQFFKSGVLLSYYYDINYSINNKLIFDQACDVFMLLNFKEIWIVSEHARVEIYNELCRTLSVYF